MFALKCAKILHIGVKSNIVYATENKYQDFIKK